MFQQMKGNTSISKKEEKDKNLKKEKKKAWLVVLHKHDPLIHLILFMLKYERIVHFWRRFAE